MRLIKRLHFFSTYFFLEIATIMTPNIVNATPDVVGILPFPKINIKTAMIKQIIPAINLDFASILSLST